MIFGHLHSTQGFFSGVCRSVGQTGTFDAAIAETENQIPREENTDPGTAILNMDRSAI